MGLNLTKDGLINEIVYLSEKLRPIYDDFLKEISCSKRVFSGCLPIKNFPSEKCIKKKYKLEVFISDLCNMGFTTPACIWISLPMESLHNKTVTNLKNFHGALQLSYDTYPYFLYDDRVMTIASPISTLLERLKHDSIKDSNWSGHKIVELIYELYDIENSIKGEPPPDRLKERKKKVYRGLVRSTEF
ncbi:MAG: ISSfl3 orfD [Proteobacteria bacterium]|nr:ISSfl3 orfD [Pseudomonadota bacterium]